jgi:organic radical activating enzyme
MKEFKEKINSFEIIKTNEWPEYDLKVTLKPCFRCNHKCWFCEEYNNNTKTWSKEQCDQVLEKIKDIPVSKKKIFFYFYGGEPTLSKHWEYLNFKLVEIFRDRELFIQTQTNLSINKKRLENFLIKINKIKELNHKIDICSSYHLNKQKVEDFIEKMHICKKYDSLGLCFFSTELPKKEQTLKELYKIANIFPDKLKMRFTETEDLVNKKIKGYEKYLNDNFLLGDDNGKSLEFRYWLKYYPELKKYFEKGWNFKVNNKVLNFSEVSGYNIHKKFKFMKCDCGIKNMVIDHDLNVYHCNDDFYNGINIIKLDKLNLTTYLNKIARCLNNHCYDGLDHKKYR